MNNKILLDTNIIRRLMENNQLMIENLASMKSKNYEFLISDMSLFELLTQEKVTDDIFNFLRIMCEYEIAPLYKVSVIPNFNEQYIEWFKCSKSVSTMRENLFPSFSFTLSIFLSDFVKAIMIFLANKLTTDYKTSEFYNYIVKCLNENDIREHFEIVIKDSYLHKKELLRKRLPEEFKDLILRELTYYHLLQHKNTFQEWEFEAEFENKKRQYFNESFKEICSKFIDESDINIKFDSQMDTLDSEFIVFFLKSTLSKGGKFDINDITDYLNFKYGFKYCYAYYTLDTTHLKKFSEIFSDPKVQNFLKNIETISNITF